MFVSKQTEALLNQEARGERQTMFTANQHNYASEEDLIQFTKSVEHKTESHKRAHSLQFELHQMRP